MLDERPFVKPLIDLPAMASKTRDMLHQSLEAFIQGDSDLARVIPEKDDEVNALYNHVYRELISVIMAEPSRID
jgi:phosphate transport system protein